jgi:hypothetical protein
LQAEKIERNSKLEFDLQSRKIGKIFIYRKGDGVPGTGKRFPNRDEKDNDSEGW